MEDTFKQEQDDFVLKINGRIEPLYELDFCPNISRQNKKYVLMFDSTDQAEVFFKYKSCLKILHWEHIRKIVAQEEGESQENIQKM